MFQSQTRSQSPGDDGITFLGFRPLRVSIADAKPIPWRLLCFSSLVSAEVQFQSQTRSQSPGDLPSLSVMFPAFQFQSQTRSQSPGDTVQKPLRCIQTISFNRRREANPLATARPRWTLQYRVLVSIA